MYMTVAGTPFTCIAPGILHKESFKPAHASALQHCMPLTLVNAQEAINCDTTLYVGFFLLISVNWQEYATSEGKAQTEEAEGRDHAASTHRCPAAV